jgi:hypothetical protein
VDSLANVDAISLILTVISAPVSHHPQSRPLSSFCPPPAEDNLVLTRSPRPRRFARPITGCAPGTPRTHPEQRQRVASSAARRQATPGALPPRRRNVDDLPFGSAGAYSESWPERRRSSTVKHPRRSLCQRRRARPAPARLPFRPERAACDRKINLFEAAQLVKDRETSFGTLLGELRVHAPSHALVEALRIPHPRPETVWTVRDLHLPVWR